MLTVKAADFGGNHRVAMDADVGNATSWRQQPLPPPVAGAH